MKSLICIFVFFGVLAVTLGQYYLPFPFYAPFPRGGDEYAASLAGAPVAWYNRETGPFYRDTRAGSLGNAQVGLYERNQPGPYFY